MPLAGADGTVFGLFCFDVLLLLLFGVLLFVSILVVAVFRSLRDVRRVGRLVAKPYMAGRVRL